MIHRCFFDGSAFPKNPGGYMAYAVMIQRDDYTLHQYSKVYTPDPSNSNNLGEYLGFRHVLQFLLNARLQSEPIIIYGDSQLVIEQMFGKWQIKEGVYTREAMHCKQLLPRFSNIKGEWIPKEKNKIAHKMIEVEIKKVMKKTMEEMDPTNSCNAGEQHDPMDGTSPSSFNPSK